MLRTAAPLLVLVACSEAVSPSSAPLPPVKVVSFNVRYGTADDGDDAWERRKDLVVRHLEALDADLVGTQEVLDFQLEELERRLPKYAAIGAGRNDGDRRGEMTPVFYSKERFAALDSGHFWLSAEPDVPGSVGWDAQLPRIATWVVLEERASGRWLYFLNTHFDHAGERARLESARLIRARVAAAEGLPVVTGDFNAAVDSDAHRILADALVDTYAAVHAQESGGTFHGFGRVQIDDRIDWILTAPTARVFDASIERASFGGRWPSDHYAVTATIAD